MLFERTIKRISMHVVSYLVIRVCSRGSSGPILIATGNKRHGKGRFFHLLLCWAFMREKSIAEQLRVPMQHSSGGISISIISIGSRTRNATTDGMKKQLNGYRLKSIVAISSGGKGIEHADPIDAETY